MSAARLSVLVTPRASANSIEALGDGSLRLRVTAAPTDGGANRAIVRILGDALGVAPGRLTIVHGAAARAKLVEVREMTAAELAERVRKIGG